MITSFRSVLGVWPTLQAAAEAIGAKREAVAKWHQRDSIPAEWWTALVQAAESQGVKVGVDELADLAASRRPAPEPVPTEMGTGGDKARNAA